MGQEIIKPKAYTSLYEVCSVKLVILFLVGLGLSAITIYFVFDNPQEFARNPMLILPGAIGIALIMIAGTYFLRKANRYLDK